VGKSVLWSGIVSSYSNDNTDDPYIVVSPLNHKSDDPTRINCTVPKNIFTDLLDIRLGDSILFTGEYEKPFTIVNAKINRCTVLTKIDYFPL
jgi:hypothetical protein